MKTYLDLSVYSKQGGLIKRRRRLSRSFTQNLMEGLYIAHAQIPNSAARGVTPVYNVGTAIDITPYYRADKAVLKVASPGGGSGTFSNLIDNSFLGHLSFVPSEMVGIVVGSSSPVVTPQDKYLVSRIPHGNRAAIATAQSLISLKVNDNYNYSINGSGGWSQVVAVCPNRQILLSSIAFLMYRSGSPGTITCAIDSVGLNFNNNNPPYGNQSFFGYGSGNWNNLGTATADGNSLPTSSSGPYAWLTFTFAAPILLEPGGYYSFRLQSAATYAYVRYNGGTGYEGRQQPLAAAAEWQALSNWQGTLFDLWGTTVDELEYGGCEVHNYQVASPSASFQISRLFRNNGANSATIGECGVQALFDYKDANGAWYHQMPVLLIAHDAISPAISLAPGQILQVTYTPSISV